ncbi:MAG: alkaline phosphatase family protein [Candidatus Marsarchaeota archaeon]|nr:alkaline phosphatase family protein [Candidatus Marsarchaeota archaeon]
MAGKEAKINAHLVVEIILNKLAPKPNPEDGNRVYPEYGGQSLVNIPHMVMNILGVRTSGIPINKELYDNKISLKGIKKVVVILLDGFGYRMWLDSNSEPGFFNKLSSKGLLIPITTTFPSTTAVGITTISTGLEPARHGLPEWVVYMKEIRLIINTLPFTMFIAEKTVDLGELKYNSKILYNGNTVYMQMRQAHVNSFAIIEKGLIGSAYTNLTRKGSTAVPFIKPDDGIIKLRELIDSKSGPTYLHFYSDNIDKVTHEYGPFSIQSRAEIAAMSHAFDRNLLGEVSRAAAKETLIIVTADHGHIKVDPDKTVYLNDDRKLMKYLATDHGKKILPTGSPRNVFLHISPRYLTEAFEYLTSRFKGMAKVMYSRDAIRLGLFGNSDPVRRLRDRIGDIIILPDSDRLIWYEHMKGKKPTFRGVHGGLSADEMLIPLGMARLSDLI